MERGSGGVCKVHRKKGASPPHDSMRADDVRLIVCSDDSAMQKSKRVSVKDSGELHKFFFFFLQN